MSERLLQMLAQVRYGFQLPFMVTAAVRADPELGLLRREAVRVQLAVAGALSCILAVSYLDGLELEDELPIGAVDWNQSVLLTLGALWSALKLADWTVAGFFAEPNDALAQSISRRFGHVEEEAPSQPRIRIPVKWGWMKLKRKLSDALVIGSVAPLMALVSCIPGVGPAAATVLSAGWALYWVAVFTAGQSVAAWAPKEPEPWFLRLLTSWTHQGLLAWWLPRLYVRALRRVTRRVHAPALAFEQAPLELTGLMAARLVMSVPFVSLLMRGSLPVSAGCVLSNQRPKSFPPSTPV